MPKRLAVIDSELCVGCQSCMFACSRRLGFGGLGRSCIQVKSVGGITRGFAVIVCRACQQPSCAKVCPTEALRFREGGGVRLDAEKCLGAGCRLCQQACPFGSVFWDDQTDKPAICFYCGYCPKYCPYGVIAMQGEESKSAG